MIFSGVFSEKEIEVFRYNVPIKEAKTLCLILDGPFEHIFVILKDPKGILRALITFKTRIHTYFIGQDVEHSLNGTMSGAIPDGEWELVVVKPQAKTGKFQIEITINKLFQQSTTDFIAVIPQDFKKVHNAKSGWYKGELHAHSYYSDGRVAHEDIKEIAEAKELDFVAMAEHSTATTIFPQSNFQLIAATEITCDNDCHYNAYGLRTPIDYSRFFATDANKDSCLNTMFKALVEEGIVLSINHPYAPEITLAHEVEIAHFSTLEVINAPHIVDENIDNEKAIRLFDFLWSEGHLLTAIGGSDAHRKNFHGTYPVAVPQNSMYMESFSISNVLKALQGGQIIITNEVSLTVEMTKAGVVILPGSEASGNILFTASADCELLWRIIENGQCIFEQQGKALKKEVKLQKQSYLRLEARKGEQTVVFVNPIKNKFNPKKNKEPSLKKLAAAFARQDALNGW